jgi:hypothetical protein
MPGPGKILYSAEAVSCGAGRNGHVTSSDKRIDLDLAFPPEMGGSGEGSNPRAAIRGLVPQRAAACRQAGQGQRGRVGGEWPGRYRPGRAAPRPVRHARDRPAEPGPRAGSLTRRGGAPGVPLFQSHAGQDHGRSAASLTGSAAHVQRCCRRRDHIRPGGARYATAIASLGGRIDGRSAREPRFAALDRALHPRPVKEEQIHA